jgi:vitamin B12 transporter
MKFKKITGVFFYMKKLIKIFFTISILVSNISIAQNGDSVTYKTEEINVISNRVATDIFSSPTRVEVISKEKIINRNGETLSDLLSLGSGIFIKSYSGNSGLSTISLNGTGAEHTLILMNGFKINSFQNAQLDLTTISKENIERIEILNNGASSLYGSEAMGGVVNIITRSPSAYDLGIKFNAQFGSYSQSKYSISANKRFSGFYINYSQSIENSENDYEFYLSNDYSSRRRQNSGYRIKNYSVDA